jgi:hypothetical protein
MLLCVAVSLKLRYVFSGSGTKPSATATAAAAVASAMEPSLGPLAPTELKRAADAALAAPPTYAEDLFDAFERHATPSYRYDALISCDLPPAVTPGTVTGSASDLRDQNSLCDLPWHRIVERRVAALVAQALSDRVTAVRVLPRSGGRGSHGGGNNDDTLAESLVWSLKGAVPVPSGVIVCLRLNGEMWARGVDRGPAANHREESHAFRGFWGEVSELRRFPDGAIVEAIGTVCMFA